MRLLGEYKAAADILIDAKRNLDAAFAAEDARLTPEPYVPGSPADEAAWVASLEQDERDAIARVIEARRALDAVPEVNMSEVADPNLPSERLLEITEQVLARTEVVIPLVDALEQAQKDMKAAGDALDRARGDVED